MRADNSRYQPLYILGEQKAKKQAKNPFSIPFCDRAEFVRNMQSKCGNRDPVELGHFRMGLALD
jgi:hypothetical protein